MDSYRAAGKQNSTGNPLCDRLQREFRGRGIGAAHVRSESTAEMIRRIQMGLDPYEDAPDPSKPTVSEIPLNPRRTVQSAPRNPSAAHRAAAQPQTAPRPKSVPQNKAASAKGASRPTAASAPRTKAAVQNEAARRRSAASAAKRSREKLEEVRIRAPFPYAAVTMLSIFTVMFMVLLFSFAQNYELTSEISALEDQARELVQLEKELSVQLEERDDIRVIENIAVNELGMVKNDLVESRFVSVTGGERVELAEENAAQEEEAPSGGIFSTMLSALGENWNRLMEYID